MPKKKKDDKLLSQLKHLQADFDNFKKRTEREKKDLIKTANIELVKQLLPIVDNFDKALKLIEDEGVHLIYKQLMKILTNNGVKEIKTSGEKFDTNLHEAVMTVKGKEKDEIIVGEVEKGYILGTKVLRPSKVIVNKKA